MIGVNSGVTHIPLYLCSADGQSMSHVTPHQETNLVKDKGVTVVHVDLDGGEEPAVTTDVMLSGKTITEHQNSKFLLKKLSASFREFSLCPRKSFRLRGQQA